jgi:hypothetical protein
MKAASTYNRSEILSLAHQIKKAENISFGEAQLKAWATTKANQVKNLLHSNIVTFQFFKEKGEVRTAIGTLSSDIFQYQAKGVATIQNPSVIKYFDLERNTFRSFRKDRFIKIVKVQSIKDIYAALAA